jgi:ABC-type polysaccharide/polyol phosphate transport system ATPase subunit
MTTAIETYELTKTFRLPHELRNSIREYFIHPLKRVDYENNVAVDRVSFEVEEGECFGVIGPNGSGKSTLMKMIAGIYRADAGEIRVRGMLSPFIELGVGFDRDLTARDNVRINATLLGLSKRELNRRYHDIVAFAELERFMDEKLKNFSSGMEVRLAYAIAIQVDFDILLLDEVLAVGDQAFQEKCYATFDQFREQGKTIVFVSHDLEAIRQSCDRVLFLRNGVREFLGTPAEALDVYAATRHEAAIGQ